MLEAMMSFHQKRHVEYYFYCLYLRKTVQWCHLWCCWHHVTLLLMSVVSCDTNTNGIISVLFIYRIEWCHLWCWHHVTLILMPSSWWNINTSDIIWCQCWWKFYHLIKKVTSNYNCLHLWKMKVILKMLTASCDANTTANGMAWSGESFCTSFLSSWPKECYDAIGINWHLTMTPLTLQDQKSHVVPHFEHLDIWEVMVVLTMQSALCDPDAGANGVTWSKNIVAVHFDNLDLRSAVVSLTKLFESCDSDASANGIIWPRILCCTSLL